MIARFGLPRIGTVDSLPFSELFNIVCYMVNYKDTLDTAFQALSDPTRRAVLHRLMKGPAAVKELAEPFDMGLPSFMKHIKVLETSGLIRSNKEGRVRTCHIRIERLEEAESWISKQRAIWEARLDRLADFVENEMIKEKN